MKSARYLVGIDLGTANCAMACADLERPGDPVLEDVPIPQVLRPGETGSRALLPSCVYLADPNEFGPGTVALPWAEEDGDVVGEFARWQGARVPGRLVTSAKSWLCHSGVDRTADLLPWGAPAGVPRASPVVATARILKHLVRAWDAAHPDAPLSRQELVLAVPASFDAVARALTADAARLAGLSDFTLVEEPQAAFEAFVWERRDTIASALDGVRSVLVVDVGGGTTDFTLVDVSGSENGPEFRRVAVGEHLILGGDNMDVALARRVEEALTAGGRRTTPGQWGQLVQACREGKEALLGEEGRDEYRASLAGSGSALLGSTVPVRLTRGEVESVLLDGFFGTCSIGDRPRKSVRTALREVSLPFAQDPSIPRQLAGFLAAHGRLGAHGGPVGARPDAMLLNGGVFRSRLLADRLLAVVSGWWPDAPPVRVLPSGSLDLAVARGAVCHGLARRGKARRVSGGSAHAIYVGLEAGDDGGRRALCVVPRGMEEGTTAELGGRPFRLTLGKPVRFPLYTSTGDRVDAPGAVLEVEEGWVPLPPLHAVVRGDDGKAGTASVHLRSALTEIGTLELWCVEERGGKRWRLEFELRGETSAGAVAEVATMPARFDEARRAVEEVFPPRGKGTIAGDGASTTKATKALWGVLERTLGQRVDWGVPVLRELWGAAWAGAQRRRRSAEQERLFFQLCGYALRPGYGYPLDDWRCEQMAGLVREGLQFPKERAVWTEYWVAWRRIAGGLAPARQEELWSMLEPHLAWELDPEYPKHRGRPKGVQPEGLHEMVRLAAALEHLEAATKEKLGRWVTVALESSAGGGGGGPWSWALGRLGARAPLYGSAHRIVSPETAELWLRALGTAAARGVDGAVFAMAQIARRTGDRALDVGDAARSSALDVIEASDGAPSWARMVREVTSLDRADAMRAMGDTLPVGLGL